LIADTGKNTLLACYHVGVYANRKMLGAGFGEDLQIATAEASKDALRTLFETTNSMRPFDFQHHATVERVIEAIRKPATAQKI
jgi:large subunit ribosomal protein L44